MIFVTMVATAMTAFSLMQQPQLPLSAARTSMPLQCAEAKNLTMGDVLAEVLARAQKKAPVSDQLALDEANLNAMLDRASADLADTFDDYSDDLFEAQRNISGRLEGSLNEGILAKAERIRNVTVRLRRGLIQPGRRRIREELSILQERQAEREREVATTYAAKNRMIGRDTWWESKLGQGGRSVRTLELAASLLGGLLFVAITDLGLNALTGTPLGGADNHAGLVLAWRLLFGGTFVTYMASLAAVTQNNA